MARGEEAWQRGILREREHAAIDKEGLGLLERLERAVGCEPAIVKTTFTKLGERLHGKSLADRRPLAPSAIPRGGYAKGRGLHEAFHGSRCDGRYVRSLRAAWVATCLVRVGSSREWWWSRRRRARNDLAARIHRVVVGRRVPLRDGGTLGGIPVRTVGQHRSDARPRRHHGRIAEYRGRRIRNLQRHGNHPRRRPENGR